MRSNKNIARVGFAWSLALPVALALSYAVSHPAANAQPAAESPAAEESDLGEPGDTPAATPDAPASDAPASGAPGSDAPADGAQPAVTGDIPVNIRLRQLEQRVQALKERAWRAKARVEMLKEAVLGGGIGARASITHVNKMGTSFRLIQLVFALDGATVFTRKEDGGKLYETKSFDILSGPITPGSHTLTVMAVYRGHGYGVFKYLTKYKFTARSSHTFTVDEGKGLTLKVVGFEKGGATTPLEDRPALDFQVSVTKD